jgi:hypothetical protein
MDDDLRALPRSETKYGDRVRDIDHFDPVDCSLCDYTGTSPEDYDEHMQEVHDL